MAGLYLITPDTADTPRLLAQVTAALSGGGVGVLQYRNKSTDAALRLTQARALRQLTLASGTRLVINDDVALAQAVAADGVHLGREDGELAAARAQLGVDAWLGAPCYADLNLARRAVAAGASYVAFGAMYPSATKPLAPVAPLSVLAAARALGVPVVAIGGITPATAATVVAGGADWLAVIGAVFEAADPAAAVQAFLRQMAAMD